MARSSHADVERRASRIHERKLAEAVEGIVALGRFYFACSGVLSPGPGTDQRLREPAAPDGRIMRFDRGVHVAAFSPSRRRENVWPSTVAAPRG